MKILIIRTTPDKVDFVKSTYNHQQLGLAKALNRKGHQCDVVYFGGSTEEQINIEYEKGKTLTVYRVKGKAFLKNGIFRDFSDIISKYDILQVGGYDQIQSWKLAKKYSDKMVVYNGTYYSDFNKRYNQKCKLIDKIFVPAYIKNNTFFVTKNVLSAEFLKAKGIVNVFPIGVGLDVDQFSVMNEYESELSARLDELKKDNKLLLYIGRIEPRRNIEFLLKVYVNVRKSNSKTKLVIIGKGNADYVQKCRNLAKELDLENDIIWIERLEQKYLAKIYRQCNVFLLPTLYEIFGMVLLEAMYFKLPVVTSLNGGSDILIKDKGTGYIIEKFDESIWSSKVIEILNDADESKNVGERANKLITEDFTWDALADRFIEVYKRCLENHN